MSAPYPFAVMLAKASIQARARRLAGEPRADVEAGVRQHDDDLDDRVDTYLAAGPMPGREAEYEIISLLRDIDDDVKECRRLVASCNVTAARMIGRIELATADQHAWEIEHAR